MKFIDISARRACSAAITPDGKLYTWHNSRSGILGHDSSNVNVLVPKEIPVNDTFRQVSFGYQDMYAVTTSSEVYVWGNVDGSAGKFRTIGTKE
jgi:alpha-tubulin suppressor-like RCC1 family protein